MEGYDASTYGERFADVYDHWYPNVGDLQGCVEAVAGLVALAGGGPVLELGVGSGRLAVPLVETGLEVHGLDASPAMLERLAARPGGGAVQAHLGDMATIEWDDPPRFAVVLAAFNTLFNLPSAAAQASCVARSAALLAPGGWLVVEAFVPAEAVGGEHGEGPHGTGTASRAAKQSVEVARIGLDEVVLSVSLSEPVEQVVTGQHVQITEAGVRLRPWVLRWSTPAELDAMAADAGLETPVRSGGWRGEPFDEQSPSAVSCWRRPVRRGPRDGR